MMKQARALVLVVSLVLTLSLAACSAGDGDADAGGSQDASQEVDDVLADGALDGLVDVGKDDVPPAGCALGDPCDDEDACTVDDRCQADGSCVGMNPPSFADDLTCTEDGCDPQEGVSHTLKAGWCLIDGACWEAGQVQLDNACFVCRDEEPEAWSSNDGLGCSDGLTCTEGDACADGSCVGVPKACDDGKECTFDVCEEGEGCVHTAVNIACDDGDACTLGDVCLDGVCVVGDVIADCDDGSVCTDDSCDPAVGCVNAFNSAGCDDDLACTAVDECVFGACVGWDDQGACPACEYVPLGAMQKSLMIQMGSEGAPGSGLDIDEDPLTCAPEGDCTGGIDNALAPVAGFLNPTFESGLESGDAVFLVELIDPKLDGTPFEANAYFAEPHHLLSAPDCGVTEDCVYELGAYNFTPGCAPLVHFDDATIVGDKLSAGGPDASFFLVLPLFDGEDVSMPILRARLEATVVVDPESGAIQSLDGLVGGAVPKAALEATLLNIVEALYPDQVDLLLNLVNNMVDEDIDLDGDGVDDATSSGFRFNTIPTQAAALSVTSGCWPDPCAGQPDATCVDGACVCDFASCGAGCCGEAQVCADGACCLPSCEGKLCGDDGCGGSCGDCLGCDGAPLGADACVDGLCVGPCCPDCEGKQCGDDGCGGSCGDCVDCDGQTLGAEACEAGQCADLCCPDCDGKQCGDDGCGGSCGTCEADWSCEAGACVPSSGCAACQSACSDDYGSCYGACGATHSSCQGACSSTYGSCAAGCSSQQSSCMSSCMGNPSCMSNCSGMYGSCMSSCSGQQNSCMGSCGGAMSGCTGSCSSQQASCMQGCPCG